MLKPTLGIVALCASVVALGSVGGAACAQTAWTPVGPRGSASLGPCISGNLVVHPVTDDVIVMHQLSTGPSNSARPSAAMICSPRTQPATWSDLAPGNPATFSHGTFWYSRAAFDAAGDMWVFGRDYGAPNGDGTISRFDFATGTPTVFPAAASNRGAHLVGIAISPVTDQIVVSFEDEDGNPTPAAGQPFDSDLDTLAVKEFKRTTQSFASLGNTSSFGFVKQTSVCFDSFGNLFVGYWNVVTLGINIITYDSSTGTWSHVGLQDFALGSISGLRIGVAPDDTLWAFYREGLAVVAHRFDLPSQSWIRVDGPGAGHNASGGHPADLSGNSWRYWLGVAFDPLTNAPTVAFNVAPTGQPWSPTPLPRFSGGQVVVTRLEGNTWATLGTRASVTDAHHPEIAYGADGTLYLGYKDRGAGSHVTVMSLPANPTMSAWKGTTSVAGAPPPLLTTDGLTPVSSGNEILDLEIVTPLPRTAITVFSLGPWPLASRNPLRLSTDTLVHGNPAISAAVLTILTSADGDVRLSFPIPPGLSGSRFILQAAATPGGSTYALTNGLLGTIW